MARVFLADFLKIFNILNMSFHSLIYCRVSVEKSADSLMSIPLWVTVFSPLAIFKIPYH